MIRLASAFGRLFDLLAWIAALILLAIVALITADILLRNTFGFGFVWSNEISEYALYGMTLLTAPWLLRQGRHVRLDLVLTMVPPKVAWTMELTSDIAGLLACIALTRYGAAMTIDSWQLNSITIRNLTFPEWWLLVPMPIIFALLAVEFVLRIDRLIRGERAARVEATSAD